MAGATKYVPIVRETLGSLHMLADAALSGNKRPAIGLFIKAASTDEAALYGRSAPGVWIGFGEMTGTGFRLRVGIGEAKGLKVDGSKGGFTAEEILRKEAETFPRLRESLALVSLEAVVQEGKEVV